MNLRIFVLSSLVAAVCSFTPHPRVARTASRLALSEKQETHRELLNQLDDSFQYEGRLRSGGDDHRCGFVSIVGAPNMGKSTLMNALMQEDLCVATRRPQTTRHAILGVISEENCQVCLVDTPGVIDDPAYKLQEGMMEAVMGAFHDADVLLVVTDLFSTPIPDDDLFAKVQRSSKPVIVVVNKVDLMDRVNPDSEENQEAGRTVTVEEAVANWRSLLPEAVAVLPVSASEGPDSLGMTALRRMLVGAEDIPAAMRGLGRPVAGMFPDGVHTITDEAAKALLPLGPPLYDEDVLTDRPERFFASEIIRAALFQNLKKEVPYCCEVRITNFKEPKETDKKQIIRIDAAVIVERDSQKGIVVGKGGEKIKQVGIEAREKLEDFLQTQVYLDLFVKVEKDWRKKEDILKQYGYLR